MPFPYTFPIKFPTRKPKGLAFDCRLIVQKPNGDKYYPEVVSGTIDTKIPFSVDTADIEVVTNTNSGTSTYMTPVNADDIVRLQVDLHFSNKKTVWQDVFEGRISSVESMFRRGNNNTVLHCRGHEEELLYRLVTSDYSTSSTSTGTIVQDMVKDYLSRIEDDGYIDTSDSSDVSEFNVRSHQKYVADVIQQLEKIENYDYVFQVKTEYDNDGNLSNVYAQWQPMTDSVSDSFAVIEGTGKIISARFETDISELYNDVTVYGDNTDPQKEGTATDSDSQSDYNKRHYVQSDMGLNTDSLCKSMANAILSQRKNPNKSGTATVVGSPHVKPGDLIPVRIDSIVTDGSTVDDDYRVKRVRHDIAYQKFETTVDLGELNLQAYELINQLYAENKQNNRNFIE